MTKRLSAIAIYAVLFLAAFRPMPAGAQFADQATLLTSVGGTNSVTATIAPSLTSYGQVKGVLLKLIPGSSNTSAATLTLNSLGSSPAIEKMTPSGLAALTGNGCELVAGMPSLLMYDGAEFVLLTTGCSVVSVGATNLTKSALAFAMPPNLTIAAAVSSNQLTVALCTNDSVLPTCNAPSAANPIPMMFRDTTVANGDPVLVSLQSSLSFGPIATTTSFGCTTAVLCRIWVYAINNSGTIGLCLYNADTSTNVTDLSETVLQTSQSGTSGGNNAGNPANSLYCSISAVATKAVRRIGYIEATWTTGGSGWAGPTTVQLFGPGVKKAGEPTGNRVFFSTASTTSCNSSTFTVPTAITASIIPQSTVNFVHVTTVSNSTSGTGSTGTAFTQISRGSSPTLIGQPSNIGTAAGVVIFSLPNEALDAPGTVSAQAYTVYCKNATASFTMTGGTIMLEEIMGMIEPANDDRPLREVG